LMRNAVRACHEDEHLRINQRKTREDPHRQTFGARSTAYTEFCITQSKCHCVRYHIHYTRLVSQSAMKARVETRYQIDSIGSNGLVC
jgi:hypothetical protein